MPPHARLPTQELFGLAFDTAPLPYLLLSADPSHTVLAVNDRYLQATGFQREDLVGLPLLQTPAANPANELLASLQRALSLRTADTMAPQCLPIVDQYGRADTTSHRWRAVHTPLVDASGGIGCILQHLEQAPAHESRLETLSEHLELERTRLNDAQAVAHIGSWELDLRGNALSWSDEAYRIFGLDPQNTVASYAAFLERVHPDDRDSVDRAYRLAIAERVPYSIEHRLLRADGSLRWVHEKCRTFYAEDGTALRSIGTVQDITERRDADERLRRSAAVFRATNQGIIVADAQARILSVNPAFTRITGHAGHDVVGSNPRLLSSGRHDRDFYQQMWREIAETGHWQGEIWNRRENGEIYPVWQNISAVRDDDGELSGYVSIFTDISEVKATEARLAHLAHHDALTGLPNRTLFSANLDQSIEQAHRHARKVGLLILDLDRFKLVNDTLGHTAGDELLQQIAQRLRQGVRAADTVARLGGDEFAIIACDLEEGQDAEPLAAKIIDMVGLPAVVAGNELMISASIGIAIYPDDATSTADLARAADAAMYRAKMRGRSTYAFYTSELSARAAENLQIENDLRRAVVNGELVLHYQPQVDVATRRIVGVEALLRWQHPRRGMMAPDSFIRLAEEGGQIDAIGDWVINAALEQSRHWAAAGLVVPRMAVNVSGRQILHDQVGRSLSAAFERHGPMPNGVLLEFEITESALLSSERCVGILQRLKDFGVSLAIDDFGTGYSSLSRLKQLPVDVLKIDRSFVHDLPTAADNVTIITAIIAMGHSLGLRIIAEGVESMEQFELLSARGCDEIQGHLLYPALSAEAMTDALQRAAAAPGTHATADQTVGSTLLLASLALTPTPDDHPAISTPSGARQGQPVLDRAQQTDAGLVISKQPSQFQSHDGLVPLLGGLQHPCAH